MKTSTDTKSIMDRRKVYMRKDRKNKKYHLPKEEIVCEYCKQRLIVNKSYGTTRNGKRIMPKHRFCSRDHAFKWNAKYGNRAVAARGERNHAYKKIDLEYYEKRIREGAMQKDIAKELDISVSCIQHRLKDKGLKIRRINADELATEFKKTGIPFCKLAEKHNLCGETVKKLLLEKGVNPRANSKHAHMALSDRITKKYLEDEGFHVIKCSNICLDRKVEIFPECKYCTIKGAVLDEINFFDLVAFKEGRSYMIEVKSERDKFSFIQTANLIKLLLQGENIGIIQVGRDKKIKKIMFFLGVDPIEKKT